jgi:hypothetical protein
LYDKTHFTGVLDHDFNGIGRRLVLPVHKTPDYFRQLPFQASIGDPLKSLRYLGRYTHRGSHFHSLALSI